MPPTETTAAPASASSPNNAETAAAPSSASSPNNAAMAAATTAPGGQAERAVIWIIIDRTGSMGDYLTACAHALAEIVPVLQLFGQGCVSVRVLAYGDYDTPDAVVEISGPDAEALAFLDAQRVHGGGDAPEAIKTALVRLLDEAASTDGGAVVHNVAWLFTDAPPHFSVAAGSSPQHLKQEREALGDRFDWLRVRADLQQRGIPVTTFLTPRLIAALCAPYAALGPLVQMASGHPDAISAAVLAVFMHMIGEAPDSEPTVMGTNLDYAAMASEVDLEADLPWGTQRFSPSGGTQRYSPRAVSALDHAFLHARLSGQLAQLPKRLKSDPALRAHVCTQLRALMVPSRVRGLKANPVLAQVWRAVCVWRRWDDCVQMLCDDFGTCLQGPGFEDMRAWKDESYNSALEIEEMLRKCSAAQRYVMRLPTAFEVPTLADTLSVLRGTFTGDVAGGVTEALRGVTLLDTAGDEGVARARGEPGGVPEALQGMTLIDTTGVEGGASADEEPGVGIPVDISDDNLFAVLFHLMRPGTLSGRRAAAITAALTLVSQSECLRERAERYLRSVQGTWTGSHDWDLYPEVFAVSFVLLVRKVHRLHPDCVLTAAEAEFFDRVWYVWRVQRTRRVTVPVRTCKPMHGKPVVLPDHRAPCVRCQVSRPTSLIVGGLCVWCLDAPPATASACSVAEGADETPAVPACVGEGKSHIAPCAAASATGGLDGAPAVPACAGEGQSHMARCRVRTCGALYAVERPELLNVQPKCYPCRIGEAAPVLACHVCGAKSLVYDQAGEDAAAWQCGVCAAGQDNTCFTNVPIEVLMAENPDLMGALELAIPQEAIDMKLRAAFKAHDAAIIAQDGVAPASLTYEGLQVLNAADVVAAVQHAVRHADTTDLCPVCCNTRALNAMRPACGRCDTLVCGDCCARWYGIVPGQCPVDEGRLACMFCKREPARLGAYCGKRNTPRAVLRAEGQVLGFCLGCRVIQGAMARECARGVVPAVSDWMCETCSVAEGQLQLEATQRCPGCGFGTVKAGGCDHIACVVCGTHWCYVCGGEFDEDVIYDHMIDMHGSIGL